MGIKDEFHQETILHCVRELILSCKADPLDTPVGDSDPAVGNAHRLLEHSFSKLERCSKCNKFLRGLQHQGFQCQGETVINVAVGQFLKLLLISECGVVAHRSCSANGLGPCCTKGPTLPWTVFGSPLCSQLNDLPAPLLVLRCTQQIESRASQDPSLDLYKLYRTTVPANTIAELRKQINEDVANTDLTEYEPAVIASILKKFLRELPDPVIPVQWYDKFIEASSE